MRGLFLWHVGNIKTVHRCPHNYYVDIGVYVVNHNCQLSIIVLCSKWVVGYVGSSVSVY